jgi:hypothetical protein
MINQETNKTISGVRHKSRVVNTASSTATCCDYPNISTVAVRSHVTRNHGPFHLLELALASVSSLLNFGVVKMNCDLRYTTANCRYIASYF